MLIMSQQRQFQMVGGQYNDTTLTKIFVGGLAWETQRDTMSRYFEQFGEILEAVVITDKNTGRSKGYGFVTFKDPEAAMRACQNPSPVIDGRRANCNLASLGANKNRPPTPQAGRFGAAPELVGMPAYHGSSPTICRQPTGQYTFPYSAYGYKYAGYSEDSMYPLNYYSVYGGQQFSPYYSSSGASGVAGLMSNIYPFYTQYAQSGQVHGFGVHYPQMVHFPLLHQHHYATASPPVPSFSSSMPMPATSEVAASVGAGASQVSAVKASEQNSST
ncbi:uncharacterized protein LOC129288977 isoform X2 [Prosopis cineraria]|uniref:uncharacterized protein LOC129288977 isoform X2 n=1 Tax=Prosopis cineraria TaxID=364024 RepID=UPI00240EFDB7|nr:uncharacterized protein LOC129288977 isoform X2 [Prosopis cineraria]